MLVDSSECSQVFARMDGVLTGRLVSDRRRRVLLVHASVLAALVLAVASLAPVLLLDSPPVSVHLTLLMLGPL